MTTKADGGWEENLKQTEWHGGLGLEPYWLTNASLLKSFVKKVEQDAYERGLEQGRSERIDEIIVRPSRNLTNDDLRELYNDGSPIVLPAITKEGESEGQTVEKALGRPDGSDRM